MTELHVFKNWSIMFKDYPFNPLRYVCEINATIIATISGKSGHV